MKIIISSVDNITNDTPLIYNFDLIWEFNRYTAKIFQYYEMIYDLNPCFATGTTDISRTIEHYAN